MECSNGNTKDLKGTAADVPDKQNEPGCCTRCCASCWAPCVPYYGRCKRTVERILDSRPKEKPTDKLACLWHERAQCSRISLITPLLVIVMYFVDIIMDSAVAYEFYVSKDYAWCTLTVLILVVSSVIVQSVSAYRLNDDQIHRDGQVHLMETELDINTTKRTYFMHALQMGPVVRNWRILRTVHKVRQLDELKDKDENTKMYIQMLLVDQQLDASLIGVFSAFLEDAPILLLQTYVFFLTHHLTFTFSNALLIANILKSMAFFANAIMSYRACLHLSDPEITPLPIGANIGLFTWNFFILISRILSLVLFASIFKAWIALVLGVHFLVSFIILIPQECSYFPDSKVKDLCFKVAIAYVHEFSFFHLEGTDVRRFGYPYYSFTFVENAILTFVWALWTDHSLGFIIGCACVVGFTFVIGLLGMTMYYRCHGSCHPLRPEPEAEEVVPLSSDPELEGGRPLRQEPETEDRRLLEENQV